MLQYANIFQNYKVYIMQLNFLELTMLINASNTLNILFDEVNIGLGREKNILLDNIQAHS